MFKMPEKYSSIGAYLLSVFLMIHTKFLDWIHGIDWNNVAVISGIIIGAATFFVNIYFQRRQELISKNDSDRRLEVMQQIAEKINPDDPPTAVKIMSDIAAQTGPTPPQKTI